MRLQVTEEHKTFFRLWASADPAVGAHLEVTNELGPPRRRTTLASRFAAPALVAAGGAPTVLVAENNGYEQDRRAFRAHYPPVRLLQNTFSDRAHCIAQLRPGSLFPPSAPRSFFGRLATGKVIVSIVPVEICRTLFQIERTALHSYGPDPHSC